MTRLKHAYGQASLAGLLLCALTVPVLAQTATPASAFPADAQALTPEALRARLVGQKFTSRYANGLTAKLRYADDQSLQLEVSTGLQAKGTWRVDGSQICMQLTEGVLSGCSEFKASGTQLYMRRYTNQEVIRLDPVNPAGLAAALPSLQPVRDPVDARFWSYFDRETGKHPDLVWSLEPKAFGLFTRPENQLLVPDGFKAEDGKWPAVVLTPTCGGTKDSTRTRIKEFLNAGYAVLTVESYKPRGTPSCRADVVTPPTVLKTH